MRARFATVSLSLAFALASGASGCHCDRDREASPAKEAPAPARPPLSLPGTLEKARVPAVAYAAVARDRVIAVEAAGLADTARRVEAKGTTVFEAASIAKTVIAVSVMQLVEQKKLDLDTDVSSYVGFKVAPPAAKTPVTLRHLLSHRGSIVDHLDQLQGGREQTKLGRFLETYLAQEDAYASTAPGTKVVYSNVGSALAAYAVERASGESFDDYSTKHVFAPLRMGSTTWAAGSGGVAVPYRLADGAFVALPQASHAIYPVVDLRSTAGDLARFAQAILRDGELDGARILQPASVVTMLAPADDAKEEALGWQLRRMAGRHVVGHEGEDAGASTGMFLDRASGTAVVVLANGDAFGSGDDARTKAIQDLFRSLFDLLDSRDAN
ncbi:MAG: beta-lactamase family protein [Deltaproteobacteria bacterium]|nr:beta-lactamase family protein [Deltaproteobacteria bacterium]